MKTPQIQSRQKLSLSPKLATALGAAVVASQADAALVLQHLDPAWVTNPKAIQGIDNFEIGANGVLVLTHSQYFHSDTIGGSSGNGAYSANNWRSNFNTTQFTTSGAPSWGNWTSPGSPITTSSRLGRVAGASGVSLAYARRGAGSFTVNAAMFTGSGVNVAKGTSDGSPYGTTGNGVSGPDNYVPVKFNLGSGDLYGLAQVAFNESGTGYVELLKFWYSDNGSELKFGNGTVSEVSAIPEVGGMVSTALLLGMAALVRSRRKDPQAGSLAALAAGVGGLMARANSSEEAA